MIIRISLPNVPQITLVKNAKVIITFRFVQKILRMNDHQNSNGSQNSQNENLHQNDSQTTTTFANNVNNILLQTACADIVSIENSCSKEVHILFDIFFLI